MDKANLIEKLQGKNIQIKLVKIKTPSAANDKAATSATPVARIAPIVQIATSTPIATTRRPNLCPVKVESESFGTEDGNEARREMLFVTEFHEDTNNSNESTARVKQEGDEVLIPSSVVDVVLQTPTKQTKVRPSNSPKSDRSASKPSKLDIKKYTKKHLVVNKFDVKRTMYECVGCGMAFYSVNLKYLKHHQLNCLAIAEDRTPVIKANEPLPNYMELGFGKVSMSTPSGCKRFYSCLTCKRCLPFNTFLQKHRKVCQPLTEQEVSLYSEWNYAQKFVVRDYPDAFTVVECQICNLWLLDKRERNLKLHREKCKSRDCSDKQTSDGVLLEPSSFNRCDTAPEETVIELEKDNQNEQEASIDLTTTDDPPASVDSTLRKARNGQPIKLRLKQNVSRSHESLSVSGQPKPTTSKTPDDQKSCYICNMSSDFFHRNLYETKSKHTFTRISDLIRKWLGQNSSTRKIDQNDENCICTDCLDKVNEYDLMCATAERIECELRETFLHTESLLKTFIKNPVLTMSNGQHTTVINSENRNKRKADCLVSTPSKLLKTSQPVVQITQFLPNGEDARAKLNVTSRNSAISKEINESNAQEKFEKVMTQTRSGRELVAFKCTECGFKAKNISEIQHHISADHSADDKNIFQCSDCPKRFPTRISLQSHARIHTTKECTICNITFETIHKYYHHRKVHVYEQPIQELTPDGKRWLQCYVCPYRTTATAQLHLHLKKHMQLTNGVYKCEICSKEFETEKRFKRHLKYHAETRKSIAPNDRTTGAKKDQKVDVKKHVKKVVKKDEWNVVPIENAVENVVNVVVPNNEENDKKNDLGCNLCWRSFRDSHSLKRHLMWHERMKCPLCGESFDSAQPMKRHMQLSRCAKMNRAKLEGQTKAASK